MSDTRRALSTIDEDKWSQILWEMERLCLGTLMAISYEHITMPWHGAFDASDMRYPPSPYIPHIPSLYILQMSSPHAAHMPPSDPQMPGPSSSYMPQMIASDPSWHQKSSSEWSEQLGTILFPCQYDPFITGSYLDPDGGLRGSLSSQMLRQHLLFLIYMITRHPII